MKSLPTICIYFIDFVWLFGYQFFRYVEHLFHLWDLLYFLMECNFVWVIRLHEYRCLQCKRHAHSPYHRMFVAVFRCIFLRIAFASFALDLSPCARMIGILTTFLILLRCKSPSYPTMNLSVCCANTTSRPVLSSIISPDFHSREDQVFHSE